MHSIKKSLYHFTSREEHQLLLSSDEQHNDVSNNAVVPNKKPVDPLLLELTQRCIDVFLASKQPNGEIGGIGYWQTANGYTAIARHDLYSCTNRNVDYLTDALCKVSSYHRNFINEFNDDTLWWGNCLLDVYEIDHKHEHLSTAIEIHCHVRKSVVLPGKHIINGQDMKGAVMWSTRCDEDQVNAITTGLYAELTARLALLTGHQTRDRLERAEQSLDWVFRCRYREHEALVLDTIKLRSRECVDWTFTYCTGQAIAASVALYLALTLQRQRHASNDYRSMRPAETYLQLACKMASKAMHRPGWVEQNGVLTENGAYGKGNHEPWQNDDAVGFKSVLVRALAKLYVALGKEHGQLKSEIGNFIETQFESLRKNDTNGNGQYGPWWDGPMEMATSHSQMAVLDVMAAIHLVRGSKEV